MSQNDFNIVNQGFPSFRSDLNGALQALASNSAGTSAPATTYAYMWWYDSTNDILKMRNADNDAWIDFATFDQANDRWAMAGSGDTGLYFDAANDALLPWNTDSGVVRDSAIDLGSSSARFKDLYLSGGVYLGGTGAANLLDDYEEGTWTPTFVPQSGSFLSLPYSADGRFGIYTIVGNRCYFEIKLQTGSSGVVVGTASGIVYVNLPFTASTVANYDNRAAASVGYSAYFKSQFNPFGAEVVNGTNTLILWHKATGTSVPAVVQASNLDTAIGGAYNRVRLIGHYELA